ncbi:hypothetical protein [uncultured Desulfovibrio sp.]|uniref:hypothetical protein n=1 Tax=uncultured Desulfovibrio sp. TaxID=167968 RepID=UPI002671FF57|nr:hypothetical protein [uncultured Desulfovibrio sp.]
MPEDDVYKEFFEPLPKVVEELRDVFAKFDLSQHQAACAAACALNQMADVTGGFPKFATVSLLSALNLKGS